MSLIIGTHIFNTSTPPRSIPYVDCLFIVTSAMTETGLNTINLNQVNTFQQALLFVLMIGGSPIFVSYFVILVRKRAFELRFLELSESYNTGRRELSHNIEASLQNCFPSSLPVERQHGNGLLSADVNEQLPAGRQHVSIPGDSHGHSATTLVPSESFGKHPSSSKEQNGGDFIVALFSELNGTEEFGDLENLGPWPKDKLTEALGVFKRKIKSSRQEKKTPRSRGGKSSAANQSSFCRRLRDKKAPADGFYQKTTVAMIPQSALL
jgi:hypothetical protein